MNGGTLRKILHWYSSIFVFKIHFMPTFNVNSVDWNELYRGEADYAPGDPGWNIGQLQPRIAHLHRSGLFRSPILDSGCGTGIATMELSRHGYDVVGLDVSESAIQRAKTVATESGISTQFAVADLTADTGYSDYFNTVVDSLVFHSLPAELRDSYIQSIARALKPGGRFFTLVFSTEAFPPHADFGPRAFTEQHLYDAIGRHLVIDDIQPARAWINVPRQLPEGFEYRNVTIGSDGRAQLPAWLAAAHRQSIG